MTTTINKQRKEAIAPPITLFLLSCIAFTFAVPLSSSLYTEYVYNYEVNVASGNTGFRLTAKANLEVLYVAPANNNQENEIEPAATTTGDITTNNAYLVRLRLTEPLFYSGHESDNNKQPLVINDKQKNLFNPDYDLYAHIVTHSNGTAYVKELYTHQADATTFKNIKKSILLNLLPTNHHLKQIPANYKQDDHQISIQPICTHDNSEDQPELFSPDSISQVRIHAKAKSAPGVKTSTQTSNNLIDSSTPNNILVGPTIFESVDGYQNVSLRSRVFALAESNLATEFHLKLVNELKSNAHEKFDQADSVSSAIKLLDLAKYQADTTQLERERRICSNHHCGKSLDELFQNYRDSLTKESTATVEASIAYLRVLDRLRDAQGTSLQEIQALLKKNTGHPDIESSLLDILAAARTRDSMLAAFKHIRFSRNDNLDISERFLSSLSVSAKTKAKMHHRRPLHSPYYYTPIASLKRSKLAREQRSKEASLDFITTEFFNIFKQTPAQKWKSTKLRWSGLLTLATLVNAYNQEHDMKTTEDELNQKVSELIMNELKSCHEEDTDCQIVNIQAIGNVGHLGDKEYQLLKQSILESGNRESVAAIRVLRDLLQNHPKDKPFDDAFNTNLKDLLLRVVYDSAKETTARVLAAEMVVRFLPNFLASEEILRHLPSFGNTELATMIYSRMSSLRPDSLEKHHENWYWKSCIINGTSTSFVRTMAKTDSMNASYGVNVENSDIGKVLKESSFDLFLDTKKQTQDLLSLGIFTRGISGYIGGKEDESLTAGMTLRLLGGYLRPIVFFKNMKEMLIHITRGTAADPMTAFIGDLLLIDHEEGYPLISGFVAEQQMRAVLSIHVSGQVEVSWFWSKNSDSLVTTKASVGVQGSQSVFTSYSDLYDSHLISFGGQAQIDFMAKVFFAGPIESCLQVTQPEFKIRYHSRRHDQMMTKEVRRRLTRRMYNISAKSYPLNPENNRMCSIMEMNNQL